MPDDLMNLNEYFTKTFVLAGTPREKEWGSQQALDDGACLSFLLATIDFAFKHNAKSADDVFAIAKTIREDALAAKKCAPTPAVRDVCDFIILYVCIPEVMTGVGTGRLGPAYDALTRSLSDYPSVLVQELDPLRAIRIGELSQLYGAEVAASLLVWYGYLYYVARVRSTLSELCEALLASARSLVQAHLAGRTLEAAVECLMNIGCWAAHAMPVVAKELAATIDSLYSNCSVPAKLRAKAGLALTTTLGSFTSTSVLDRANDVLTNWKSHLKDHEYLQLLAVTAIKDCDSTKLQKLIDAADNLAAHMKTIAAERAYLRYGGERLFDILTPALSRLIHESRADDLCRLLEAWYGIEAPRRNGRIVFVTCRDKYAHWFTATKSVLVERDESSEALLIAFTSALNAFAGTTVTIANTRELEVKEPERLGVPDATKAPALLAAITDVYGLDANELSTPFPDDHALRPVPHWSSSIQSALLIAAGWTLPIAASLQEPAANRRVLRAMYWGGGTLVETFELNAIRATFSAAGIQLDVVQGSDCTLDRFIKVYASAVYDLLWVTSHCEYDHFDPHQAYLKLNPAGASVSLLELERVAVPETGRRLLVLNVCDGATAAALRGALGLGLANSLAGSHQAVISHGWPVDQRIAPVFGALLARNIAAMADDYFGAFCRTLRSMNQPKDALANTIGNEHAAFSELTNRVRNVSLESDNFAFWGSPVYLE